MEAYAVDGFEQHYLHYDHLFVSLYLTGNYISIHEETGSHLLFVAAALKNYPASLSFCFHVKEIDCDRTVVAHESSFEGVLVWL